MSPARNDALLSRRRFLTATSLLGATALAAACSSSSSGSSGGKFNGTLTVLLPDAIPTGWQPVLSEVNKRLKADLGFQINPQFTAWSNYGQQTLLKFTAGGNFGTALQARWLNMTQLVQDGSLAELTGKLGAYKNLSATIDPTALKANEWDGKLWGIPQVNSAARLAHFAIRQDLAEKYGLSTIADYDTLEKFWYDVKQRESGVIPMTLNTGSVDQTATFISVPLFNRAFWENPNFGVPQQFTGESVSFYFARDAATTGSSNPIPFWEVPEVVDAFRRVLKYYQDGIVNHDALNLDKATEQSYFTSGKAASTWAMTDGTSSALLPNLRKAIPTAAMANVVPLTGGKQAKPNQLFQADNFVVVNGKGDNLTPALQLQDWLSIKENHDLLEYGLPDKDWKAVGDDQYEALSRYAFPGYALSWRAPLERLASYTTETEKDWFAWAQDYDNFTTDTFASFIPDVTPVKSQNTQLAAAMVRYSKPLSAGAVDVDKGLDDLKKACQRAGLDKVQAELAKQGDAYLKSVKKS